MSRALVLQATAFLSQAGAAVPVVIAGTSRGFLSVYSPSDLQRAVVQRRWSNPDHIPCEEVCLKRLLLYLTFDSGSLAFLQRLAVSCTAGANEQQHYALTILPLVQRRCTRLHYFSQWIAAGEDYPPLRFPVPNNMPFLRTLRVDIMYAMFGDEELCSIPERLPQLEELIICGKFLAGWSDEGLANFSRALSKQNRLRFLKIHPDAFRCAKTGTTRASTDGEFMKNLPASLIHLDLTRLPLAEINFTYLFRLRNLERITFPTSHRHPNIDMRYIANAISASGSSNIGCLDLVQDLNVTLKDSDFESLAIVFPSVCRLVVRHCTGLNNTKDLALLSTTLRALDMGGTDVRDLAFLPETAQLEELYLPSSANDDIAKFVTSKYLPRLRRLKLCAFSEYGYEMSGHKLDLWTPPSTLQSLIAERCVPSDETKFLRNGPLPCLTHLVISALRVWDEDGVKTRKEESAMVDIANKPNPMQYLLGVGAAGVVPPLEELDVSSHIMTGRVGLLAALSKTLRILRLDDCLLRLEDLQTLAGIPWCQLSQLDLGPGMHGEKDEEWHATLKALKEKVSCANG